MEIRQQKTSEFDIKIFAELPRKFQTLLIGIDGYGGSGKSTFARKIQNTLPDTQIVHMDDFYDGNHIIWQRVGKEILEPLSRNENVKYQIYEWHKKKLDEWREVKVGGIVVVEGILSLKTEIADFYDYKIWISCPREIRLERGIKRDGEKWRDIWVNQWMPREDHYVLHEFPDKRADLILYGS